jgi:hypothetical protein
MTLIDEKRRLFRQTLFLNARARSGTQLPFDAVISDLTTSGCCLSTIARPASLGLRISIRPEGLEAISGSVRWVVGGRFGVEFDSPLYEPVVDHLRRTYSGDL